MLTVRSDTEKADSPCNTALCVTGERRTLRCVRHGTVNRCETQAREMIGMRNQAIGVRARIASLMVAGAALAFTAAAAGPATAAVPAKADVAVRPDGTGAAMELWNLNSTKCLSVAQASQAGAAPIIQWDCYGGLEEYWRATSVEYAGHVYQELVDANSGKCLAVPAGSTADGTHLIQYGCDGGHEQLWTFVGDSYGVTDPAQGFGEFVNLNSGKCLAVGGGSTTAGAPVIQWDCDHGNEQQWTASS